MIRGAIGIFIACLMILMYASNERHHLERRNCGLAHLPIYVYMNPNVLRMNELTGTIVTKLSIE